MSKTSYLDEPADVRAEPGTKTHARGIAAKIKFSVSKLDFDVSSVQEWIQIAVEFDAWKVLGYISLDAFLVSEAGITQDFIDAIRNAKQGSTVRDIKAQVESARENPAAKHGEVGNGRSRVDNVKSTRGGNETEYTLRRLARDGHDELLDAIEAGEISVNQAAIQVGYRKKKTPEELAIHHFNRCESRLVVLKAICESLEPHEREVVDAWLQERDA